MVPIAYSYRNLLVRWRTTCMTAAGFMLVVALLMVMLAFVNGVRAVCATAGRPENVICLAKGKSDEILSRIGHRLASQIEMTPGVVRDPQDRPLASRELYLAVSRRNVQSGEVGFLQVRGVSPAALAVHPQVRVTQGRMIKRHRREAVVGAGVARTQNIKPGDTLEIADWQWDVVGVFEAGGSAFESEVWCDMNQLATRFHQQGACSSVVLKTRDAQAARQAVEYLHDSRLTTVEAMIETEYYQKQADQIDIIRTGAIVIAAFMALGAVLGVTNTMFAAIGQRVTDIAVLRLLGFSRMEILGSFLLEALLIALVGGAVGILAGYAVHGMTLNTALGTRRLAFAFRIDASILTVAAVFTVAMGFVGGLFPALSAMRVKPLDSFQ